MSRLPAALLAIALPAVADDLTETIVVTPERGAQAAGKATAPATVIPGAEVERGKSLDETLRRDPSFALFRRSSSLVADPSSQGVNLRGVGPSGVSRALVLEDGVPLNDGFGGWMYWGSVPRLGVSRVEIAPGASSALYGSSALGGVVQIVTRPIEDHLDVELQGGRFETASGALSVGGRSGRLGGSVDLEGLRTGGYGVLASPGPIDQPAFSRRGAVRARLEAGLAEGVVATARLAGFAEDQNGGTRYTTAAAGETLAALGLSAGAVEARAFARWARFSQERARIQPDRSVEDPASAQRAPADDQGISLQWSRGGFLAGGDLRRVFGRSIEEPALGAIALTAVSGEQRLGGVFAQQLLEPLPWLRVQGALRMDFWSNLGGVRHEALESGRVNDTGLPDRSDVALSPRLALRAHVLPWMSVRAAGYRSFRAPTLNELYRPFQVGPVRTEANPQLGPETLLGAEAGFDLPWLRATGFIAQLRDPIVNVTVGTNQQMRQNIGSARVRGLELTGLWAPVSALRLSLAWTFIDARLSSGNLAGRLLPQDPRHRLVAAASFADPRIVEVDVQLRWTSEQFEDDANRLRLPGFAVFDLQVARTVAPGWEVFAAAENLLDRRYLVGLQGGIATVGQPLFVRAGVRARLF